MKDLKIINSLNILQKVILEDDCTIAFYFGNALHWPFRYDRVYGAVEPKDYYEVVKVKSIESLRDLYWKIHRYSGQQMFLQESKNKINIWEGEISGYCEEWGAFDDVEEIQHEAYEFFTTEKTIEDWKREHESLRKVYNELYHRKSFQLKEYRRAIRDEFKDRINSRVEHLKASGHIIDSELLREVNSGLDDERSGMKHSSIVDFIFE